MTEEPTTQTPESAPESEQSNADKLKQRLDRLEDMYFRPFAYETKIAQWEVKELREHRPYLWKDEPTPADSSAPEIAESGGQAMAIPAYISSAANLAEFLHGYFKDRITISITPTLLGLWRKGQGVGKVVIEGRMVKPPPFPNKAKSGNRFVTRECIDWVERWIVPQKTADGRGAVAETGSDSAADFDTIKREHAVWQMQREKDVANGRFKSVEVFNQHCTIFGAALNRALNDGEKDLKRALIIDGLAEGAAANRARVFVDGLRAALAKSLLDARETDGTTEAADDTDK